MADFSPLFRTAIGFDRLARLVDSLPDNTAAAYPPYNIEKTGDDSYRLSLAVAGFSAEATSSPTYSITFHLPPL